MTASTSAAAALLKQAPTLCGSERPSNKRSFSLGLSKISVQIVLGFLRPFIACYGDVLMILLFKIVFEERGVFFIDCYVTFSSLLA
ncbi:MAG: hypothetical protein ACJ0G1_05420 [Gammaproteobacteria bacterium]